VELLPSGWHLLLQIALFTAVMTLVSATIAVRHPKGTTTLLAVAIRTDSTGSFSDVMQLRPFCCLLDLTADGSSFYN
jgi:hypothetical protein